MTRLAEYMPRLPARSLRADIAIEYGQRAQGTLRVFRTARADGDGPGATANRAGKCGIALPPDDRRRQAGEYQTSPGPRQGLVSAYCRATNRRLPALRHRAVRKRARLGVPVSLQHRHPTPAGAGPGHAGVQLAGGELLSADRYVLAWAAARALLAPRWGWICRCTPVRLFAHVPLLGPPMRRCPTPHGPEPTRNWR